MGGKGKGSAFERELAKQFGRWWTGNERDDVFWRTDNSGGRATVRAKIGVDTFGQCGDLQASDPIGQPLMDLFVIEVKRGYKEGHLGNLLDAGENNAEQQFEKFLNQVITDYEKSNAISWMLVSKRNRRESIITIPKQIYVDFLQVGVPLASIKPLFKASIQLKTTDRLIRIVSFHLTRFFELVEKQDILNILEKRNT